MWRFIKPFLRTEIIFVAKLILLIGLILLQTEFAYWYKKDIKFYSVYLDAMLFAVTSNLIVDFIQITIIHLYLQRKKLALNMDNFTIGINRIASLVIYIVYFLALLIAFSIDIKQVFTSLSIFAAALALLFKDYVSNMVNGLIIMFSDQLSLNDYVKIGIQKGRIADITYINIKLYNDDDEIVYIPNNTIFMTDVINYTKRASKRVSFEFEMSYANLEVVDDLEQHLIQDLEDFKQYISPNSFNLKIVEIRKDYAMLKFQYNILDTTLKKVEYKIRKILSEAVVNYIRQQSQALPNG